MMNKPLLILKAGNTYPEVIRIYGDFEAWFRAGIDPAREDLVVEVFREDTSWPDFRDFAGTIVTGSHDDVTDHTPWMEQLALWLQEALEAGHPILGVCFGHQMLAYAAGGTVADHPGGQELGSVEITLTEEGKKDPLFTGLPETFPVHVNHAQTIQSLPAAAQLLAYNGFEPTHAFRINNAAGVQFHPEYTAEIMRAQIRAQQVQIEKSGRRVQTLLKKVTNQNYGKIILENFIRTLD